MSVPTWTFDDMQLVVTGLPALATAAIERETIIEGIEHYHLRLEGVEPGDAGAVQCRFELPGSDCPCVFIPKLSAGQSVWPDYPWNGYVSSATGNVPLQCVYGLDGGNRCTVAVADTMHQVRIGCGIDFPTNHLVLRITPFEGGREPGTVLVATIRLDRRPQRWEQAARDTVAWWEAAQTRPPLVCPDAGRLPMYSTWYSFGKALEEDALLEQCRLAKDLGCEAILIDDGWQTKEATRNNQGGYATAGDWQPERFPDMADLVDRIHRTGLKALLWYAVPHAGLCTEVFKRLGDDVRCIQERAQVGVLDPRSPAVRCHLVETLTRQVREWGLDGLKLDFVGQFAVQRDRPGRHVGDLDEATDALMAAIQAELRTVRPDLMIEYRQDYYGPAMRRHGNIFRSVDCPNDALRNRGRSLTLRLLTGNAVVHGDMLQWHVDDPPEVAARQLLAVLFAVPQLSMRLERLPASHLAMLRFWLGWWRAHRDCLLGGELWCDSPEAGWPLVRSAGDAEEIIAVYDQRVVPLAASGPRRRWMVNASTETRLAVRCTQTLGPHLIRCRDCTGREAGATTLDLTIGIHDIAIPPSGVAELERRGT